jgi:hypothetical protein
MSDKNKELFIILVSVVFISLGIYFTVFHTPEESNKPIKIVNECSTSTPIYCITESQCNNINLYWWNDSCHLTQEEKSKPSEFSDYNYYLEMKHLELVSTTTESIVKDPENMKEDDKIIKRFIKQDGNIANAYLFVDVSVDFGKPLTVWDSIYISFQRMAINNNIEYPYKPFIGGHLLRSKTIKVPEGSATRLLYDLRNVPFTYIPYSDSNDVTYNNLIKMLNNDYADGYKINENNNQIIFEFKTFLSTLRKGGYINKISIGYECAEETPNCKLRFAEQSK